MSWLHCTDLSWYFDAIKVKRLAPKKTVFNSLQELLSSFDEELAELDKWMRRN